MQLTQTIEWEAKEYEFKERSSDWFWAMGIIAVALAVVSVILDNFLFAIIIILTAFIIMMYQVRPPEMMHHTVNKEGVRVGKLLYPYDNLKSFWVHAEDDRKIILISKRSFMPVITIDLPDDNPDPELVRQYLIQHLEEVKHEPGFIEQLADLIKF